MEIIENTCPVCLEDDKDTLTLFCKHNICGECLILLYQHNSEKVMCPLCRYVLWDEIVIKDESVEDMEEGVRGDVEDGDTTANVEEIEDSEEGRDENRGLCRISCQASPEFMSCMVQITMAILCFCFAWFVFFGL